MKTYRPAFLMSIVALLVLVGCATSDPRLGLDSRTGYVSEVYSVERLRKDPPRCLAMLTPAQIAIGEYVEIRIPHGRYSEYLSAFVPPSMRPSMHDKVEISPQYCKDGRVPEVRQILYGSATPDGTAKGPLSQGKKGQ